MFRAVFWVFTPYISPQVVCKLMEKNGKVCRNPVVWMDIDAL